MIPALARLRSGTQGSPYEGGLWVVGGAVRDALIAEQDVENHLAGDIDITLEGDALACAKWLHEQGVSSIYPVLYERFGTAMVMVEGVQIEFATARRDNYEFDSRKPTVSPATLVEDARRRDFTCNTLMWNLHTGEVLDPLGTGLDDLRNKVLRAPAAPETCFSEDPLRILRAVRFAHQLGFAYCQETQSAITKLAPRLKIISKERIMVEVSKMLTGPDPAGAMRDLMELSVLAEFWPEFSAGIGMDQGPYHKLDVWGHTLAVLDAAPRGDLLLSLACLFHDVGKPRCRTVDGDGRIRFFGHEEVGAKMAGQMLRDLKFSHDLAGDVSKLVAMHMRLNQANEWGAAASRRLVRDAGPLLDPLLRLVRADRMGHMVSLPGPELDAIEASLRAIQHQAAQKPLESPLDGKQIMKLLDIAPGPVLRDAKEALLHEVLEGHFEPDDTQRAQDFIRQWYNQRTQRVEGDNP